MIAPNRRFGRSIVKSLFTVIACILLTIVTVQEALAFGANPTILKLEYQYSDYNRYTFPLDTNEYKYLDPYVSNFPEHRSLVKLIQSIGPVITFEFRHEYSALTEDKNQHRYYGRFDRDVAELTGIYVAYQYLNIGYESPDSSSGGFMVSLGGKHDLSGWIKAEASFSYDHHRASDGTLTESYMPMAQLRWSINSVTALTGRWDGYWAVTEGKTYPAHSLTVFISRYMPTQTAVHLFSRFYHNDYGIESVSPAIEVAQYIRWNLTARVAYRFYRNWFENEASPDFIEGNSLTSHSIRTNIEYQFRYDMKLHLKLRRYVSDQDIRMNTYLIGFEYEI